MNKKNKYFLLLSDTLIFAIGNVLTKVISVFLMPLYTMYLTTEEYGTAELFNSFLDIIFPIVTLCIVDALYRFVIDETNFKMIFSSALSVILKGVSGVVVICLVGYIITNNPLILYFMGLFVTYTFFKVSTQFARGLGHVKRFSIAGVINAVILVFADFILLKYFNGGMKAYLLSLIIAYGISGILSFFMSKEYRYFDWKYRDGELIKDMLAFSIPNVPNMLSWWINNVSDRYILMWIRGAGVAGIYAAAGKMPAIINMWSMVFQQAWQYWASKEMKDENNVNFYTTVFKYFSAFMFVVCAVMIAIIKYIIPYLLKNEFLEGWIFIPFLLVAATLSCFCSFFGGFYTARKENFMAMVSTIVGAIVNLVLNFLLIPQFGGLGAAVATLISYLVILVVRIIDTNKFINLKVNWTTYISLLIIIFVESVFLVLNKPYTNLGVTICIIFVLGISLKDMGNFVKK